MTPITVAKAGPLKGEIKIPGDKSISHRSVMLSSLAKGVTRITNFLPGADCISTINAFRRLGIDIDCSDSHNEVFIKGKGLHGLRDYPGVLDAGNSGTTARLISGILAGFSFETKITGDASLQKRPMSRIFSPLTQMGAHFFCDYDNGCVPFTVKGTRLKSIHYTSPVASAQVKSAIIFAGMYADGLTMVTEPVVSRDHSERMLKALGARINGFENTVYIEPEPDLRAIDIKVPGDISSAAFFLAAASIIPGSALLLKDVGLNPTRDGIIRVARNMGADISILNIREDFLGGEQTADIFVKSAPLYGTVIDAPLIPSLIDEIPIIAVMAANASGTTVIRDAQELMVKESNRIETIVSNLSAMGADITATDDGMIINGLNPLHGAKIHTKLDHRIAMAFAIAGMAADGETVIDDKDCCLVSYPDYFEEISRICDGLSFRNGFK